MRLQKLMLQVTEQGPEQTQAQGGGGKKVHDSRIQVHHEMRVPCNCAGHVR